VPPPLQRPNRGHRASGAWLLLPLVVGALLRAWNVRHQIVLGDELHSLRPVLLWDLRKILTTFPVVDDSIPLVTLFRLASNAGVPLSEGLLKLPSVASGVALVGLAAIVLRRDDRSRALIVTWGLALSPALVFYSRIFRPYAITVFLATLAAWAFWRWWGGGATRWAALYASAASLAIWFHLPSAPYVLAPLLFGIVESLRRRAIARPRRRPLTAVLVLAASVAVLTSAAIGPALPSLRRMLGDKVGDGSIRLGTVAGALELLAGSASAGFVALFWLLAAAGAWRLVRREHELGGFTATAVALQCLAVVVVRPRLVQDPIVFGRYLLVVLPVVWLWIAEGLLLGSAALANLVGRVPERRVRHAVVAAFVAGLAAAHPFLADPRLRLGAFAGSDAAIHFAGAPPTLDPDELPSTYRIIDANPGIEPVLEAPSSTAWWQTEGELAASRVHRRSVILAGVDPWLASPRLALRTLLPATPAALRASGARFVVVHLYRGEMLWNARHTGPRRRSSARRPVLLHDEGVVLADRLEEVWGEPQWTDGTILVWDLGRLRRELSAGR
jgi:hypothetical protein